MRDKLTAAALLQDKLSLPIGHSFRSANFDGESIYLWKGKTHDNSPLVATIGLEGFSNLLAYAALNPMPLPNLLTGYAGLVGRPVGGQATLKSLHVFKRDGSASLLYGNLPIKRYGDFLDRVAAEVKLPALYPTSFAIAAFKNAAGVASEATVSNPPFFLSAYEGRPLYFDKPVMFALNYSGFDINAGFYICPGAKLTFYPHNQDLVFEHAQASPKKLEIQIGIRRWLAALIQVREEIRQSTAGRIVSAVPESTDIALPYASRVQVFTSGWTTPIAAISVGNYQCVAIKNLIIGNLGTL